VSLVITYFGMRGMLKEHPSEANSPSELIALILCVLCPIINTILAGATITDIIKLQRKRIKFRIDARSVARKIFLFKEGN
jgi:hypothetical protein